MRKATVTVLIVVTAIACGGGGSSTPTPSSPTPTPAPCAGTPEPIADTHNIELPRVGGDYTRQLPVDAYILGAPGSPVDVEVLTLDGGLLGSVRLTVSAAYKGRLHRIDGILVMQAIPDKTRACAVLEGKGWKAEIPVRVGGANP